MLHIHRNVDGTYLIDLEAESSDGSVIVRFHGNFSQVNNEESTQDLEHKFEINCAVILDR